MDFAKSWVDFCQSAHCVFSTGNYRILPLESYSQNMVSSSQKSKMARRFLVLNGILKKKFWRSTSKYSRHRSQEGVCITLSMKASGWGGSRFPTVCRWLILPPKESALCVPNSPYHFIHDETETQGGELASEFKAMERTRSRIQCHRSLKHVFLASRCLFHLTPHFCVCLSEFDFTWLSGLQSLSHLFLSPLS